MPVVRCGRCGIEQYVTGTQGCRYCVQCDFVIKLADARRNNTLVDDEEVVE